jgi:hypothetical protein
VKVIPASLLNEIHPHGKPRLFSHVVCGINQGTGNGMQLFQREGAKATQFLGFHIK